MVTMKNKSVEYTQKERKESKCITTISQLNTKEDNKGQ